MEEDVKERLVRVETKVDNINDKLDRFQEKIEDHMKEDAQTLKHVVTWMTEKKAEANQTAKIGSIIKWALGIIATLVGIYIALK